MDNGMYDVVSLYLSDGMMRCVSIWTLSISAVVIFAMAFAVTTGASFACPLGLLRGAQRFFLCALSIALAYAAAFLADTGWTPPGPFVILFIIFAIAIMISAARHLMAPAISADNTWSGAWRIVRARSRNLLMENDGPSKVPGVR